MCGGDPMITDLWINALCSKRLAAATIAGALITVGYTIGRASRGRS